MKPILEVNNLSKAFKNFSLENVSFTLKEDCITGFIGVNGAGKTTTIKAILNLILKDTGSIRFREKDIEKNEGAFKDRIGVVMDEGYFYEDLTLKDMKSVIAPAYSTWDDSVFHHYMDRFKLNLSQKISTLSKGMRMKFALAIALSHHADLLIMDEPTSGLDPLVRSELMEILLDFMMEEGKSVFFSTHITSDLEKVADELILIDEGRILLHEAKDELIDRHALVKGDTAFLNEYTKKLFLSLHITSYGFEGITDQLSVVKEQMSQIVAERPSIEQIMLAYLGGDQ
ncbi:ABC transporter ATP-binding protein [Bacillus sp. APMAM]|nr:ABC transporter ATP-binding protein [Bacillus sp. APMAM]RTZ55327.1 ABC transporter ATP-binding protein [Bacillus sp. SAJ1]